MTTFGVLLVVFGLLLFVLMPGLKSTAASAQSANGAGGIIDRLATIFSKLSNRMLSVITMLGILLITLPYLSLIHISEPTRPY